MAARPSERLAVASSWKYTGNRDGTAEQTRELQDRSGRFAERVRRSAPELEAHAATIAIDSSGRKAG
jgi:hypothetical protein